MSQLYKKYLSTIDQEKIDNGSLTEAEKQGILRKYNNILRIISTYIPQNIVSTKLKNVKDAKHEGRFIEGTLLFADVNGFTAMTEKLSRHGHDGSEEITRILNQFFTAMIEIIFSYNGILLKYGGDAMMIYFSSENEFHGDNYMYHALSCAVTMRDRVRDFATVESKYGVFSLSVSVAVLSGTFFETTVGDQQFHREYYLTGENVEKTAMMESSAGRNEVVVDKKTAEKLKDRVIESRVKDNGVSIIRFDALDVPPLTQAREEIDFDDFDALFKRLDTLLPYVTRGVYSKVKESWENLVLEGEHRPVTVMFINYYFSKNIHKEFGHKEEKLIQSIYSDYFMMIQRNVEEYGGTINKVDMYTRGDKIILIFGFPHSHQDDEIRAVRAAYDIIQDGKQFINKKIKNRTFSILQRIGIHSGFIFSGNVGAPFRKEYTIMGDAVNISARIMSSAKPGQLLISDSVLKKTESIVTIKSSEEKTFKGKTEKFLIHEVGGLNAAEREQHEFFVGRARELEFLHRLFEQSKVSYGFIQIIGPGGVGKTFLVHEFLKSVDTDHLLLQGRGITHGSDIQYHAIKQILVLIFGITKGDSNAKIKERIDQSVKSLKLENMAFSLPLLGSLLSDSYKDDPVLEIEDPVEKKELLFNTFYQLIKRQSELRQVIMIIEDSEWLDENSHELLRYIIKKGLNRVFILLMTRGAKSFPKEVVNLNLEPFSKEEAYDFIRKYPHLNNIPPDVQRQIYLQSKGIPYFLFEMLNSIRDHGFDSRLPESIYKVLLSRMDELGEEYKDLLKTASVIGAEFPVALLQKLFPRKNLTLMLDEMIAEDFLLKHDEKKYYFRNVMVQEVTYNSISMQKKRDLHYRIGTLYEAEPDVSQYYALIGFHFEMADVFEKAVYYFEISGDQALKINNYKMAAHYFDKAIALMPKLKKSSKNEKTSTALMIKIGKVFMAENELKKAGEFFSNAAASAERNSQPCEMAAIAMNMGTVHLKRFAYEKSEVSFQQALDGFKKKKDTKNAADCQLNLGTIARALRNHETALQYFKEALENYQKTKNKSGCAGVYNNIGNLLRELGQIDDALTNYRKAKDLFKKIGHETGYAGVLNNIGALYNTIGKFEEAIGFFKESLAIEEKIGNDKEKAVCLNNLGNSHVLLHEWDAADGFFEQAQDIALNMKDLREMGNIFTNRGVLFVYQEKYDAARSLLLNAVTSYTPISERNGLYTAYYNLGLISVKENNREQAVDYFDSALAEARHLDKKVYAEAAFNIGRFLFSLGEGGKAEDIVTSGVTAIDNANYPSLLKNMYELLGRINGSLKNTEGSIRCLLKAKKICGEIHDVKGEADLDMRLATLYIDAGKPEKAGPLLDQVMTYFNKTNDAVGRVLCLGRIARLYEAQKDYENALEYYERNIAELKKMGLAHQSTGILKMVGAMLRGQNDVSRAVTYLEEAARIEEEASDRRAVETYILLGEISAESGDAGRALDYYERALALCGESADAKHYQLALKIGELYGAAGKLSDAIPFLEKASLAKDPDISSIADKYLVLFYKERGDRVKLITVLNRLHDLERKAETKKLIEKCLNDI